jgi:hypothetical protein
MVYFVLGAFGLAAVAYWLYKKQVERNAYRNSEEYKNSDEYKNRPKKEER